MKMISGNTPITWDKFYLKSYNSQPWSNGNKGDSYILDHINEIQDKKNKIVLDAGCGQGKNSLELSKYFKEIHSCDYSRIAVNKLKGYNKKNIKLFICNIFDIKKKSNYMYDLIVDAGLCHTQEEQDVINIIKLYSTILNNDGYLSIRFFKAPNKFQIIQKLDEINVFGAPIEWIENILTKYFAIVDVKEDIEYGKFGCYYILGKFNEFNEN